jgi:uncharacterized protein
MSAGVLVAMHVAKVPGGVLARAVVPIRAVGKTALSNYVLQTLIGTTLAYPHAISEHVHLGFGLFGGVSRSTLPLIVAATWAFQLTVSTLWTRHFRQGPLEWLWHRMVYWNNSYPLRPAEAAVGLRPN